VLYTYLPKWAYEGGKTQILSSISEPESRRKILDYLRAQDYDFSRIVISEASNGANFIGKNLKQIAQNQAVSPEEAVLNVLAATSSQVTVFDHNLSDEQMELFCASPLSFIATDGAGYSIKNSTLVHPRCFGAMPKFLKLVREKKIMKWEQAIKKLTQEPCEFLGLTDRGTLKAKNYADVVIFDPQTITDKAEYNNPNMISDGIDIVLVNGKIAYSISKVSSLNGQVLKR
jgi:N-acyl-D-amino-acid deacylase